MPITSGPSKIPASFIDRTIKRLLPSTSDILKLPKEQLLKLLEKKDELIELIKAEPVRFWTPNPGGQTGFATEQRKDKRCKFYFAGNKSGKTTAGAIRFMERLVGRALWGIEQRGNITYPVPARGAIFAEDFDSHKEVSIPTILSWMPKGIIKKEVKNSAGHVVEHQLLNGSLIHYRTYDQGSEKAEGKDWHIVWSDEPPPRNVYTAAFRGVVSTDGELLITATLLKEAWLFDEIDQPHVAYYSGDIDDNQWLSSEARRDFLASLTEDELEVRKSGKPTSLVGLIYKGFRDGPPHVGIDSPIPPPNCPTVLIVDPHERKPCHCGWLYILPDNDLVFFKKALISGSVRQIEAQLKELELELDSPPKICIMDPNRGSARQIQMETAQPFSWQTVFESFGYQVILGNDNINYGHTTVKDYLSYTLNEDGSLKLKPRMRFAETCRGRDGPIYQMLRYSWDDYANKTKMERGAKEKPKDRFKDWPDVIRYAATADLNYDALRYGPEILDTWKDRSKDGIRGYV